MTSALTPNTAPLAALFNFDAEDLLANRAGQLSKKQRAHWQTRHQPGRWLRLAFGLGLVVLAFIPNQGYSLFETLRALLTASQLPAVTLGLCVALPLGGLFIGRALLPQNYTVHKAVGPVQLETIPQTRKTRFTFFLHELRVAEQTFEISAELRPYFQPGQIYAIYYLKAGSVNKIISLETLQQPA